jgi:hypothetical protein
MKERAKQEAADAQMGGGGTLTIPQGITNFAEIKAGRISFNILPFSVTTKRTAKLTGMEEGQEFYRIPFRQHRQIGPENLRRVCPTTISLRCPVCDEMNVIRATAEDDSEYSGLRYSKRSLFLVNQKDELRLLDISDHAFTKALLIEMDEMDAEGEDLWVTDQNALVSVRFEEEPAGTGTYPKAARISIKEGDDVEDEIYDAALEIDLGEALEILDYDKLKAEFHGADPEDDEDEDEKEEEDKPPRRKRRREEPEEDPEDEPEEEPEEDPEDDKDGEEEPDEEPEEKEEKSSAKKGKCPYGYKFGKDFDKYDECDDCEEDHLKTYKACRDAGK